MAQAFQDLTVWQRAMEMSECIYRLTKTFPKEELYILTSQIKRAADSISLNIAEGSTGQSDAEFSKFLGYSLRSAIEVISCLYIGKKRDLIDNDTFAKFYNETENLVIMIQALRKSIK